MSEGTCTAVDELTVFDKFTGERLASLASLSVADVGEVLAAAHASVPRAASLPRHRRAGILDRAARLLEDRLDATAALLVSESGKTVRQARKEVSRAVNTLRLSSHEALRNAGEVVPFDAFPGAENRRGWYTREPLGLIVAITPYNDSLNLVAHKLGPAIAGGNAVILKPAEQTPLAAIMLVDLLAEAGLPESVVTVVHGDRDVAQALISARGVRMVSFTGGFATGEAIARNAGIKRLAMELGGNAPVVVFDDADLAFAVDATVSGAFWAAGQNCIGAQRVLVQSASFPRFVDLLVQATRRLVVGDPRDERTDVGPMISEDAASRAQRSIRDAQERGAVLHVGGERRGPVLTPAVLTGVPRECALWAEEAFAPIVIVEPFLTEADAVDAANDSEYALHAGVFTTDLDRALRMAEAIDAGGVMINDSSDFRLDAMPFGGSKYGSMGREGVRFAYEEMTQPKVVAIASR